MSHYYYFIASLPYFLMEDAPPFALVEFTKKVSTLLNEEDRAELSHLLAGHAAATTTDFAKNWFNAETQLRNAIATRRVAAYLAQADDYLKPQTGYSVYVDETVEDAYSQAHPLDRERVLDRLRWETADELARRDPFGPPAIFAYALKLQLATRWTAIKPVEGRKQLEEVLTANLENKPLW